MKSMIFRSKKSSLGALCLFSLNSLDEMLVKGNVWYVRHYEDFFENVFVVYLYSSSSRSITRGRTTLISVAARDPKFLGLFLAPFKLLWVASRIDFSAFLSADILFSWWDFSLVKLLKRGKYILMPVCMPHELYKNNKKSLIGLPRIVEKVLVWLSFKSSSLVLTGRGFGAFEAWLSSSNLSKTKLRVVPVIPEALPSKRFLEKMVMNSAEKRVMDKEEFVMLYIGGLREEKLIDDLVYMLRFLLDQEGLKMPYRLRLVGDGPFKKTLIALSKSLGVEKFVDFVGAVENENLPEEYSSADVFLSPLTGTSLREAAICGLPVVAYDMDWVSGVFIHGKDVLFAKRGDYEEMGRLVSSLRRDPLLQENLSKHIKITGEALFYMSSEAKKALVGVFQDFNLQNSFE